jgi:hypothetical protein
VAIAVDDEHPGWAIAQNFAGLSLESSVLASPYLTPGNRSLLGLIRGLGRHGVIRLGGNDSERTFWRAGGFEPPSADWHVITPEAIDRLAATLDVLDWRLIYGLNLARGTPESTAAEADYVARRIGPRLIAFQIGNEPDGFGRWAKERPPGYDAAAFIGEWLRFFASIRARVPKVPFAGPDVAAETGWIAPFAAATRGHVVLLTRHYYADGPAGDPRVTIDRLLHSSGRLTPTLAELKSLSETYRLPYRIAEANSVFSGGRHGVSDTFAAALWGTEVMFQIAAAGGVGINFHGGDNRVYTPILRGPDGRYRAQPLYYAMLMFREASRGRLVPVQLGAAMPDLAAYATRFRNGGLCLCLINKDTRRAAAGRVVTKRRFKGGRIIRLAGRSVDATDGVSLGGAEVDAFGHWTPRSHEAVTWHADRPVVDVPAASAALVFLDP